VTNRSFWQWLLELLGRRQVRELDQSATFPATAIDPDPLPPLSVSELEDWIIDKGDAVIQRRAFYPEHVSPEENLVYCFWCVDYGMRNAGDLEAALQIKSDVMAEGLRLSTELGLTECRSFFSQSRREVEKRYFGQFETVCSELEAAYQAMLERHL
jgi:hypothetical protein